MNVEEASKEIRSILEDMERCMDKHRGKAVPEGSPFKDKSYRAGYYAAIRDARRLVRESTYII